MHCYFGIDWHKTDFKWFVLASRTTVSHAAQNREVNKYHLHACKQTRTDVLITTRQICNGETFRAPLYPPREVCVLDLFTRMYLSHHSDLSDKVTSQNFSPFFSFTSYWEYELLFADHESLNNLHSTQRGVQCAMYQVNSVQMKMNRCCIM